MGQRNTISQAVYLFLREIMVWMVNINIMPPKYHNIFAITPCSSTIWYGTEVACEKVQFLQGDIEANFLVQLSSISSLHLQ